MTYFSESNRVFKATGKTIILNNLIFTLLDRRWEDKSFELNGSEH
jgi:hypothetical protein